MPYCRECGNRRSFGTSQTPPAAPTANGPLAGLMATFDTAGQVATVTRYGADRATARAAQANPRAFFDTCMSCGSQDIAWEE